MKVTPDPHSGDLRKKDLRNVTKLVNKVDPKRDGRGRFRKRASQPEPKPTRYGE